MPTTDFRTVTDTKNLRNSRGRAPLISNGNRTEWSPIWSVIIRVIIKSDDRAAVVRFVYHEYDYRPNWTTQSLITNLSQLQFQLQFLRERIPRYEREGKFAFKDGQRRRKLLIVLKLTTVSLVIETKVVIG